MKKISLLLLTLLFITSCTEDVWQDSNIDKEKKSVNAHFSYSLVPMKDCNGKALTTRSTAPTNVNESGIDNLWVVQYDNTGAFLEKTYLPTVKSNAFEAQLTATNSGGSSTIYFVANIGPLIGDVATETRFKVSYKPISTEATILYTGADGKKYIPMYGVLTNTIVPINGVLESSTINLTRLLTRVDVVYSVNSAIASTFTLESARIGNIPNSVPYFPPAAATTTPTINTGTTGYFTLAYESVPDPSSGTMTFYLPENQQGEGANATTDDRLKSGMPNATYIDLIGHTKGTLGVEEIYYHIYPGANNYNNYNMIRNTYYTYNLTINTPVSTDTRVLRPQRSNSYILEYGTGAASTVNIPLARANESTLGTQIADVTAVPAANVGISWQTSASLITLDKTNLSKGYVTVNANNSSIAGNAVIAVTDGTNILWSWHIWVLSPANNPNLTSNQINTAGCTWMKLDLGATAYAPAATYATSGGFYYQWGRKDPFLNATTTSGTAPTIVGYTAPTYTNPSITVSSIAGDSYARSYDISANYTNQLLYSVRYPMLFFNNWAGSMATTIAANTAIGGLNSWGGEFGQTKTIYDPCPQGWRVPSFKRTSTSLVSPWASMTWTGGTAPSGTASNTNYGTDVNYGTYPMTGYRTALGIFAGIGGYPSFRWSATRNTSSISSMDVYFTNSSSITPSDANHSQTGFNVRCVKVW